VASQELQMQESRLPAEPALRRAVPEIWLPASAAQPQEQLQAERPQDEAQPDANAPL
jgi:hypothetical protein